MAFDIHEENQRRTAAWRKFAMLLAASTAAAATVLALLALYLL